MVPVQYIAAEQRQVFVPGHHVSFSGRILVDGDKSLKYMPGYALATYTFYPSHSQIT